MTPKQRKQEIDDFIQDSLEPFLLEMTPKQRKQEIDDFIQDSLEPFFVSTVNPWDVSTYDPKSTHGGSRELASAIDSLITLKISPIAIRDNIFILMRRWKKTRILGK
jgi:hypothetical protein